MKNKYLKSKCGYDMQGENQNTEKSRITERVRSWEKYGGWTNLKPKGIQTTLMGVFSLVSITIMLISGFVMYIWFSTLSREYPKADGTDGGESGRLSCQYETGV